jgi:hypothetical protein
MSKYPKNVELTGQWAAEVAEILGFVDRDTGAPKVMHSEDLIDAIKNLQERVVALTKHQRYSLARADELEKSIEASRVEYKALMKTQGVLRMGLCDEFAKAAMAGLLANPSYDQCPAHTLAESAYKYAKAMFKERGAK